MDRERDLTQARWVLNEEARIHRKAAGLILVHGAHAAVVHLLRVAEACDFRARQYTVEMNSAEPVDTVVDHNLLTDLARAAYHAYGERTDFRNFQGNPMPAWGDLGETIQDAWRAAAIGFLAAVADWDTHDLGNATTWAAYRKNRKS